MANYTATKAIINSNIVTNNNEDITAVVLNMVLTALIDYTKDVNFDLFQALTNLGLKIGDLSNLNTTDKTNLVNAINEVLMNGGGGGIDWNSPTPSALGYYNALLNKIDNSNLLNKSSGVVNSGVYIAKTKKGNISGDVQLEDAENFIYTMTGNVNFKFDNLTLANDESAVITIQLTGSFAFSFPVGVVAQPYNDTYDGGKTNYLTVVITETVIGAIKGYYSLITA